MNVSQERALPQPARLYPGARWDQSPLFKKVYEQEFGQLGGEPYGCLIGDYYFSHLPTDVQLLRDLQQDRRRRACALLRRRRSDADGHGHLDGAVQSARPRQDLRHAGIRGLEVAARRGGFRAMSACACRACCRALPYGAKSEPVEEFAFEEETDGHKGEKYAWMNAAYAMAVNINRAFKEYGWCTRIRGVQSGGEVINLPTHTFPTDDGGVDLKCPTEIAISDRREAELAKSGLIPLDPPQEHRQGGLHRRAVGLQAEGVLRDRRRRGDRLRQSVVAPALHVRGVALRALPEVHGARQDRLHEGEGPAAALAAGVDHRVRRRRSGELHRSRPRRASRWPMRAVEVFEDEENPGYYSAKFYLRPHLPARRHGYRPEPGLAAARRPKT